MGPSKEQPSVLRIGQITKKIQEGFKITRNAEDTMTQYQFVSHCVAGYRRWEEKANSKAFIEKAECRCIDAVEIIFVINEL